MGRTPVGVCDIVIDGSFYRFQSRSRGEQLSRILDEGRRLLEAEGHRRVRGRYFLGRRRTPEVLSMVERSRWTDRRSWD